MRANVLRPVMLSPARRPTIAGFAHQPLVGPCQLFVRDDGTVDWDGAIQSGREVARFGQVQWMSALRFFAKLVLPGEEQGAD